MSDHPPILISQHEKDRLEADMKQGCVSTYYAAPPRTPDRDGLIQKLLLLQNEPRYSDPLNSDIYSGAIDDAIAIVRQYEKDNDVKSDLCNAIYDAGIPPSQCVGLSLPTKDCIAIIRQHESQQPPFALAMRNATEILTNFKPEGERMKTDEWAAAYAALFNQMQPLMEENRRLQEQVSSYEMPVFKDFKIPDPHEAFRAITTDLLLDGPDPVCQTPTNYDGVEAEDAPTLPHSGQVGNAVASCTHGNPAGEKGCLLCTFTLQQREICDNEELKGRLAKALTFKNEIAELWPIIRPYLRTTEPERWCPSCGGNDADHPCAYPGERKRGCMLDERLCIPEPVIVNLATAANDMIYVTASGNVPESTTDGYRKLAETCAKAWGLKWK